jgi:hypothetical protein
VGQYLNGQKSGRGTFYFLNTDRYEGNWREERFDGQGVYHFANGDRYEGQLPS